MSRKKFAWFFLGCMGTALFVAVLYALLQGARSSQSGEDIVQAIRDTQVGNHAVLTTIQDCTQPTGKCYKRGQKQTAAAVGNINRVIILAAACASSLPADQSVVDRQNAIQSCVIDGLSSHKR